MESSDDDLEIDIDDDDIEDVQASFCGGFDFAKFFEYLKSLKYFWIAIIFSSAWCAIWYVWFRYGNLPPANDYVYALSDFSIVFSLFFYEYLRRSWQDYTAGPQLYYRMLFRVWMLGVDIYSVIELRDSNEKLLITDAMSTLTDSAKREVETMMYHTSLIFMPHKRDRITKPHQDPCLDEMDSTKGFIMSLCQLKRILSELQRLGCITTAGFNSLNNKMKGLDKSIEDIKASQTVNDLDAIYIHVVIVIGIYFVVVIPYKIVTSVSYIVFVVYPFLIFSMMGTFMIRRYVGSPFDKNSPAKNPLHKWYEEFVTSNNESYSKFISMCAEIGSVDITELEKVNNSVRERKVQTQKPFVEPSSAKYEIPMHAIQHIINGSIGEIV